MNQTHKILPVYTSDVSGVCSALYELGGMVVMHDPSGCNSTYNTHDEIRWYEKDSLIFISALTERDALMGNDRKFYEDVLDTAKELKPKFVAVTNSPIPYMMGTDFPALMGKLERELGIPCFYVPANGMHDYTMGAGRAFLGVAKRLVNAEYTSAVKHCVNVIGMTPLDYAAPGSTKGICRILEGAGYRVNSVWALDAPAEDIEKSAEAAVNLVVSSTGLLAAKYLQERFGIPYVAGTPVGDFTGVLIRALEEAEAGKMTKAAYLEPAIRSEPAAGTEAPTISEPAARAEESVRTEQSARHGQSVNSGIGGGKAPGRVRDVCTLIGEPVVMGSFAAAVRLGRGMETRVLCPTEIHDGLIGEADTAVHGEEETAALLHEGDIIVADPMYRHICPPDVSFWELPTVALSGRIYLKKIPGIPGLQFGGM